MIRWTGLAPWEYEFPFPGSLTSTVLKAQETLNGESGFRFRVVGFVERMGGRV